MMPARINSKPSHTIMKNILLLTFHLLLGIVIGLLSLNTQAQSVRIATIGDNTVNMLLVEKQGDTFKQYIAKLKGSLTSDVDGKIQSLDGTIQSLESDDGKSVKVIKAELRDGTLIIVTEDHRHFIIYDLNSNLVGKIRVEPNVSSDENNRSQQGVSDTNSFFNQGYAYKHGEGVAKDYAEAVRLYRKGAELGDSRAQLELGLCYENGEGVSKDAVEAVMLYRKAAESGSTMAQNNFGQCYSAGTGVAQDHAEAVKWYRKAADQGNLVAQYNLAICYTTGQGVEKDKSEAVKWYRKAAEKWLVPAEYNLSACYVNGTGVGQDYAEAYYWCKLAALQGHAGATRTLPQFERALTQDEIVRVNARVAKTSEIHDAAKTGSLDQVKALLKENPNLVFCKDAKYGGTPLHWAAAAGQKDMVDFLLSNNAEVDARANDDATPLQWATAENHKEVADFLRQYAQSHH